MWLILLVSVAGFLAQLIDGSMGMAFGVSATSLLLFLAYSPAAASAIVHLAEVATTAVSGLSHIKFGNVHWPTLLKIAIPGSLGAFVGAMLLSDLDLSAARPRDFGHFAGIGISDNRQICEEESTRSSEAWPEAMACSSWACRWLC